MASVAIDDRSFAPDERASRLFEEHSEWLLRYCVRQLGERVDAEDAVQTTFLYAFRALRRGVVPECERAWLTTIARNVCHSQRRHLQRHPEETGADFDRIALAQPDVAEVGFMDDVRSSLSSLPETQRRALVLREWRGVPSNEIATELQLSEPATHALLFRARRSFATAMSASGRPFAGLNVALLLDQLRGWAKPLLGGAAVKAAVVTTAAGVAVGGAVLELRVDAGAPSRPTQPPVVPTGVDAPGATSRPTVERRDERVASATGERAGPVNRASQPRVATPVVPTVGVAGKRAPRHAAAPTAPLAPIADAPDRGPPTPAAPPLPAPPPVDLPPIAGQAPPIELPPALEDLLPPAEAPPLPPLAPPTLPLP